MKFPTLKELKLQSRIDHDDEDDLFQMYLDSAIERAETYLNKKLFEDNIDEYCSSGMLLTADIKLALILYVNYRYENRDPSKTPEGFYEHLRPHRDIPL